MMNIDEAISRALEVARQNEDSAILYKNCKEIKRDTYEVLTAEAAEQKCLSCAAEHRQLAEWLTELKEAKRLLKAAVEDMCWLNENTQDSYGSCTIRTEHGCSGCPFDINSDLFCKWKHEAEALALIGEDTNVPASADNINVGGKIEGDR